jgi:hypothetical protein
MRTKPPFGKKEPFGSQTKIDNPLGCIWSILLTVVAYYVLMAITRVTSGIGNKLDQIIRYGALVGFVIILLFGFLGGNRHKKVLVAERQNWKNTCKSAEVAIVDRQHSPGRTYEDDYGVHNFKGFNRLYLEMNADQRVVASNQQVLCIDVYSDVYEKLEERNTVRIYYKPESPLIFLLEEEI